MPCARDRRVTITSASSRLPHAPEPPAMAVPFMPPGYHSLTPSVVVDNANKAMDFYRDAFGAKETFRMPMGDKIAHAEMDIDGSRFMLSDEFEEWGAFFFINDAAAT